MDPVEIDIRMRQNVADESKKAAKAVRDLGNDSKKAQAEVQQSISIQKKVLSEMRSELALLEKDFKKINVGTQDPKVSAEKAKLSQAVRNLKREIELEEQALKKLEKQTTTYKDKSKNLETQIRNVRNEMAALKMQGKENTKEYRVLEERLGLLGTAYKELTATQKALSTGGTQTAGILSGLSAVSGAFAATAGAMGLVNSNSKDMEKIQTRLQSLMSITIGLQQISNTLHKTSAFRITTVRKAKELWAIANTKVAATLGMTNVQAQILMGTLTLGLSVAITAVIYAIDKYITKKRKAAEMNKKFQQSVVETSASILVRYRKMQEEWNKLGKNLKDKQKYIDDNKKSFEELGVAINSVNDADNLFITNSKAFQEAIMERAQATAYMELATAKYKEAIKKQMKADNFLNKKHQWGGLDVSKDKIKETKEYKKLKADADKANSEANNFILKKIEADKKVREKLKESRIVSTKEIKEGTTAYWEQQKKSAEEAIKNMHDSDIGGKEWEKQKKKYMLASEMLKKRELKATNNTTEDNKKAQAKKRLASLDAEMEKDANDLVLAIMAEGLQKKLKAIDNEYNERKNRIESQRKKLQQTEKELGIKSPERHRQLDDNEKKLDDWRKNKKSIAITAFNTEHSKEWNELLKQYQTYEDKKTEILKRYANDRAKLEAKNKGGQYDDNIEALEKAKAKELFTLEKSAGKVKSTIAEIFSDLSGKSVAELNKILQKAEGVLAFLKSGTYNAEQGQLYGIDEDTFKSISTNPESLKAITDLITKLRGQTKTLGQHFSTLFKKGVGHNEFNNSLNKVNQKMQGAVQLTNMFSGTLKDIADLSGSGFLSDIADGLSSITQVASGLMQGVQTGAVFGPTGALIGGALGFISSIAGMGAAAEKAHREALQRIKSAEINQQREYNRLLFQQKMLMKDKESIFGVEAIAKAVGYLSLYNITFQKLQDKFKKKLDVISLFGGLAELKVFRSELDKIQVKIGHKKTGLFGWGKGKDIYGSITSKYPDLIKANGEFNKQRAEALLKEEQFAKGSKEALQEIINLYDQAQEAEKQFNEYLQSTFGELGSSIIDSVINALQNGEDAFESFAKSVGNVMGKLGKQIMYELFVSSKFKEFQKQLKDIYGKNGSSKQTAIDVRKAIADFVNNVKGEMGAIQNFAEEWQKQTKELGFDVWNNENNRRSVASKGIAQASQASIDDGLGRLYALVRIENEIKEQNNTAISLQYQGIDIQSAMLQQLDVIAENTSNNKYLKDIAEDIEDMKQQGIKVKM